MLVIDDDPAHAQAIVEIAERAGFRTLCAHSGREGIGLLQQGGVDVVVTDLVMRDRSGLDVIAAANAPGFPHPRPQIVIVTGYGSEDAAPAALRAGAASYLTKPLAVEVFRSVLDRIARDLKTRRQARAALECVGGTDGFWGMIGQSGAMAKVFDLVRRVADSNATVLIEGESGTGKELVARALHEGSARRNCPFVAVNCAALSAGLLESELFGHDKGAFTGAHTTRIGRFEAATGGTLFLDEVGEMSHPLQAKLLRAIEEREVVRVGSNNAIPVDVRLVAASNRRLKSLIESGEFREDLFYRLNVVRLHLPPLRERMGDVPLLVEHFLAEIVAEHGRDGLGIEPDVVQRLAALPWRGNVRELRNFLETLVVTCEGDSIALTDLTAEVREPSGDRQPAPLSMRPLAEVERELIANTLRDLGGNRAKAAQTLGISTRTLYRRIKELRLS